MQILQVGRGEDPGDHRVSVPAQGSRPGYRTSAEVVGRAFERGLSERAHEAIHPFRIRIVAAPRDEAALHLHDLILRQGADLGNLRFDLSGIQRSQFLLRGGRAGFGCKGWQCRQTREYADRRKNS